MATRRSAGRTSLTGSISELQRRVKYLQMRPSPSRLGNESVSRANIRPRAVSTDQIALDAIANNQIQADAISSAKLQQDSVTSREIKSGAVQNAELDTDSVSNVKIREDAVDSRVIDFRTIQESNVATDSVDFRILSIDAVGNENLRGNSVGNAEVQDNAIDQGNLQNDSVGSGEIQTGAVGFAEIGSGAVGTSSIAAGAVTSSRIGGGAVGTSQLANLSVTGEKIANGTITGTKIASRTITSNNILQASMNTIVAEGLQASNGISKAANSIQVTFGTASNQVPRGNHTHTYRRTTGLSQDAQTSGPNQTSSRTAKKEITSYKIDEPKKILSLDLKQYKYKNNFKDYHLNSGKEWLHGYIIEELLELGIEEPVGYDKDGNPSTLMFHVLTMYIIEVLKEQQKEIDALRKEMKK